VAGLATLNSEELEAARDLLRTGGESIGSEYLDCRFWKDDKIDQGCQKVGGIRVELTRSRKSRSLSPLYTWTPRSLRDLKARRVRIYNKKGVAWLFSREKKFWLRRVYYAFKW